MQLYTRTRLINCPYNELEFTLRTHHVLHLFTYFLVYIQKAQHYADILTNGLRSKHRWFGGWDIGRRLPFVLVSYFAVQPSVTLVS